MKLNRLLTAAAAGIVAWPAFAFAAADAPTDTAPASAAPATPAPPAAPALPSIPKITGGTDLYETAKAAGQFTILVKALDAAGITPVLKRYPNLTLFAPTDDAFKALPADQLAKLMSPGDANANQLQQILKYHLVNAQLDSSKIRGAKGPVPTVENTPVVLDGSNPEDLLVNNADIIQADVHTANGGILHAIDKVLIPSDSPLAAQLSPAQPAAAATPSTAAPTGG